jgi:membrane protease YdiL (CAAX protease family)
MATKISEIGVFIMCGIFLVFLWLAFNERLATLYLLMLFVAYIILDKFKLPFIVENRTDNRAMAFIIAAVAYVAFLVVTTAVFSLSKVLVQYAHFESIIQLYATATPILQGSKLLTIIAWGFLIPIIETIFFFGMLFALSINTAKTTTGADVSPSKFSLGLLFVMIIVSALFTLFHITSKGLSSIPLLITFIFAMTSLALVFITKETKSAIILHIISNTIAVLSTLGIYFSTVKV